jgi:O-antigen/teichoic acid export membrane protein
MNPLTGSLKFLATTLLNSVLALVFFLFAAHYASPVFVGRVAVLQLLETGSATALTVVPGQVVNRELGYTLGGGKSGSAYSAAGTVLLSGLLLSPLTLFLLFFPRYLWLAIPYYVLYIYFNYQANVLSGLGRFTEVNTMSAVFSLTRWGLSTLGVFLGLRYLILFWTLGGLVRVLWAEIVFRALRVPRTLDFGLLRRLVVLGVPLYLSGVTSFIASQGDRLIVVYLLGSYYLGVYQLVALIGGVPSLLLGSLQGALIPSSSYHHGRGVPVDQMGGSAFRLISLFGFLLASVAAGVGPLFLTHFFPAYSLGALPLRILLVSVTLTFVFSATGYFLVTSAHYRPFLIVALTGAIVDVLVSLLLIPRLSILGAALAQASTDLAVSALTLYYAWRLQVVPSTRIEKTIVALSGLALLGLTPFWPLPLLVLPLCYRLLGLIKRADVDALRSFAPLRLKKAVGALEILCSD